jgi:plastocyanin
MKTSYILIGIVLVVVIIGGVMIFKPNNAPQVEEQPHSPLMVMYSDRGYSPKELKIKKGETVTFMNESSQPMWTASAIHPSHTAYPKTDVRNCGNETMMLEMMFDACVGTLVGESWTFQFNEAGSWGYHNHLRPTHTGKIIVL